MRSEDHIARSATGPPAPAAASRARAPPRPARPAPRAQPAVLDDSANALFVTEIFRGMALTLKAFFDPKVTVRACAGRMRPHGAATAGWNCVAAAAGAAAAAAAARRGARTGGVWGCRQCKEGGQGRPSRFCGEGEGSVQRPLTAGTFARPCRAPPDQLPV